MSEASNRTRKRDNAPLRQEIRPLGQAMTLQNLIFPEKGLCLEPQMFVHSHGAVAHDRDLGAYWIAQDAVAKFDTYFNALSIAKWHKACNLHGLWLGLTGLGKVEVTVLHALSNNYHEVLVSAVIDLTLTDETRLDLSHYIDNAATGMITFEVRAIDHGVRLASARYLTQTQPNPNLRLAIVITTFRREAQVQATARRLAHYLERAEFGAQMDCFIIDNGDSAQIDPHPKIRCFPNANLGGAGGFTRGLLQATADGCSHVVFMDDDAAIPTEALHRTFAFLALAKDDRAAIAGALINTTERALMAENGAVLNHKCNALFRGTDLRNFGAVFHMEQKSALVRPPKLYGGWWFFAFPIAHVRTFPFPFFVRGDDVNFSLANDFLITTLNGVVAFADSFVDKETPLNWYLDLRSHMVHHLALETMATSRCRLIAIPLAFVRRNIVKFQYETIEAVLLAWGDVLKGPDYFATQPDATAARAAIKALVKSEVWQPLAQFDLEEREGYLGHNWHARRKFYPWSLNGHLLPFFGRWGAKRIIPADQRGLSDAVWGAAQLTFLNVVGDQAYATRRNTPRAAWLLVRVLGLSVRTWVQHGTLRARYRSRYPQITTPAFWRKALNLAPDP